MGSISLVIVARHKKAILGYWVAVPFWNKGYTTEATKAIIDFGFKNLNLNKIYATHSIQNEASGKVVQKAGMIKEGTLTEHELGKDSEYRTLDQYRILKREFDNSGTVKINQIMDWTFEKIISTEQELREIMGYPSEITTKKTINYIDENCIKFIEKSPFITIASSDLNGNFDVSPKGDPAGFVQILNEKILAIPDRPGNRKADTLSNIIQNPNVGLLFLIPGIRETLRVNGTAKIVTDEKVLELLSCNGKVPSLAIIVEVQEAFIHCAKCIIRSKLWRNVDESKERNIPTLAKVLVDHSKVNINPDDLDEKIKNDEKTKLY